MASASSSRAPPRSSASSEALYGEDLSQSLAASFRSEFSPDDEEAAAVAQLFGNMRGDEIEKFFKSIL